MTRDEIMTILDGYSYLLEHNLFDKYKEEVAQAILNKLYWEKNINE